MILLISFLAALWIVFGLLSFMITNNYWWSRFGFGYFSKRSINSWTNIWIYMFGHVSLMGAILFIMMDTHEEKY